MSISESTPVPAPTRDEPDAAAAPPTPDAAPSPPRASGVRGFVARHPMASYLGLSFGIASPVLYPLALADLPLEPAILPLSFLALLGPAIAVTAIEGGRPAARELLSRTFRWRVHPAWYALAAFGLPVVMLLGAVVLRGTAPLEVLRDHPAIITTYLLSLLLLPLVNLWEETGWMGFVQARLGRRHGPLLGAVITAPLFALFHLPIWIDPSSVTNTLISILAGLVLVVPFRIMLGWIYQGTGASVLVVGLAHASFNAANNAELMAAVVGSSGFLRDGGAVIITLVLLAVPAGWALRRPARH